MDQLQQHATGVQGEDILLYDDNESIWSGTCGSSGTSTGSSDDSTLQESSDESECTIMMGDQRFVVKNVHPNDVGASMVAVGATTGSVCPVCPKRCSRLKRHVLQEHLPWFLNPATACFSCKEQTGHWHQLNLKHDQCPNFTVDTMNAWCGEVWSILHLMASSLDLENLNDLLRYVIDRRLYPCSANNYEEYNSPFNSYEVEWMQHFDRHCTSDFRSDVQYHPSPPNRLICILHWRTLLNVLCLLPPVVVSKIFETTATFM